MSGPLSAEHAHIQREGRAVIERVAAQIAAWGIEHDERGRQADAYLWCVEARDPETGYVVPLMSTRIISVNGRIIARLVPDHFARRYDIEIATGVSDEEMEAAKPGTVIRQHLVPPATPLCPDPRSTHMSKLRDERGLRLWEPEETTPRPGDFYQERLYCIRWNDRAGTRTYESVTQADLKREQRAADLLAERWVEWREKGFIPTVSISPGRSNSAPIRTRGWTHWHQLFTPRQLLINGLISREINASSASPELTRGIAYLVNYNSKLCTWDSLINKSANVFYSQSISPAYNYASRSSLSCLDSLEFDFPAVPAPHAVSQRRAPQRQAPRAQPRRHEPAAPRVDPAGEQPDR